MNDQYEYTVGSTPIQIHGNNQFLFTGNVCACVCVCVCGVCGVCACVYVHCVCMCACVCTLCVINVPYPLRS